MPIPARDSGDARISAPAGQQFDLSGCLYEVESFEGMAGYGTPTSKKALE